ncbi:MAG: hypothetical protein KAQ62_24565 [Cyclobacteriaceae bacterium]|nr:hypothetical protein [Cyclobacteriaceae bacterium]MCK5371768.1 hypothetical protein [Cyclobacteriaceae bacterium]MCK5704524.1 hypothetical protein [Cyclobacteriaceae bacterium]
MDNQVVDQKLQEALKLFDDGKSYSDIRNHFKSELNEETISYIIRLVDEFAIEETRIREEIKKAKFKMYLGLIAFAVSVLLVYKFYINDSLSGAISLLAYLPMVFALYLLWKGYKEEQILKKTEPEIDDSKFRMKRRRKK